MSNGHGADRVLPYPNPRLCEHMFVIRPGRSRNDPRAQRAAWLRGQLVSCLNLSRRDEAIACLAELQALGEAHPSDAALIVRALHISHDPRAERWLVRLVARIMIDQHLDLDGADEVMALAERYAEDPEAREALARYCQQGQHSN